MTVEYTIFDIVNGWAGHFAWLDAMGRLLAAFGLLAVLLATFASLWQVGQPAESRRRYLLALLASTAVFAALIGLEALLAHHLGHELRSRPANARWTTMLITPNTGLAFPCWPVAMSATASLLLLLHRRAPGIAALVVTGLQAVAFVFVGANYPFDVLTGLFLGLVLGLAAAIVARLSPNLRDRTLVLPGVLLILWLGFIAATVKPASDVDTGNVPARGATMPAQAQTTINIAPGATLQLATNGHLTVGWLQIEVPGETTTLAVLESQTREAVNRIFATHAAVGLLTVTVTGRFGSGRGAKMGTLYTATVDRADWPVDGFTPQQKLPGEKYIHPRLLKQQASSVP